MVLAMKEEGEDSGSRIAEKKKFPDVKVPPLIISINIGNILCNRINSFFYSQTEKEVNMNIFH